MLNYVQRKLNNSKNPVIAKSNENLQGKIKEVNIINGNSNTLFGEEIRKTDRENCAA